MADGQKSSECRELLKVRDVTKRFRLEAGLFASGKKQVSILFRNFRRRRGDLRLGGRIRQRKIDFGEMYRRRLFVR